MSKNSLLIIGLSLLLASCGGDKTTQPKETATIQLLSEKERGEVIANDELVNLSVDLKGLANVEKVEFYRDGVLLGTDKTAPFTWRDEVSESGKHSYQAVAYTTSGAVDRSNYIDLTSKLKAKLTTLTGTLHEYASFSYPLQLKDWQGGTGTMTLKSGNTTLTSGAIAADGTFSVPLSAPPTSTLVAATPANLIAFTGLKDCTGSPTVTPATTNTTPLIAVARAEVSASTANHSGAAAPIQLLQPSTANGQEQEKQVKYVNVGLLIYAQTAVNIEGGLTCLNPSGKKTDFDFALLLGKGWNKVTQQYTINPSDPTLGKLSFAMRYPEGENWVLLPSQAGLPQQQ